MELLRKVTGGAHTLGAVILGLVFVSVVVNVVARVLWHELVWVGEMCGYAVVWCVYLGVAFVLREGRHVKVELVSERLPPRPRAVMRILGDDLASVVFSAIVVWNSARLTEVAWRTHRTTALTGWPVWPIMLVVPVGMALFGLEAIADAVTAMRSFRGRADATPVPGARSEG